MVRQAFDGDDAPAARAWQWLTAAEVEALPTPTELVWGHVEAGSLILLRGPRGLGRTFPGLDLACTIAAGAPWHGQRGDAGWVANILAEGRGGLAHRVRARGEEPAPTRAYGS